MRLAQCLVCNDEIRGIGLQRLCAKCVTESRWCNQCGTVKSLEAFYRSRRDSQGRTRFCKPCHQAHITRPENSERQKEYHYLYHLRRKLGVSLDEAKRLAEISVCECCGKPRGRERFHIDHDHDTGLVRGAICRRCNYAVAVLEDRELADAVRSYLERSYLAEVV